MKPYEVEVEIIQSVEVVVIAEGLEDAADKVERLTINEIMQEGCLQDFERRIIGVRRSADKRMYR